MAELSDNTNWSELDASNNKASPNGWPEGMMPSGVNDSARADKGALKRFWNRMNPVQQIAPTSGVWTFTTGNPTYPTAYVDGEAYWFMPLSNSAAGDSFQVNALGAKPIFRWQAGGGWTAVRALDMATKYPAQLIYDSTLNGGAGGFLLGNPFLPIAGDGAGGISAGGNLTVAGNLTVSGAGSSAFGGPVQAAGLIVTTGPAAGLDFTARDNSSQNWLWYASANAARLNVGGGDVAAIDTNGNMRLLGHYLFLTNGAGAVNTTGGPFVYADTVSMVFKLGSGNGYWLFQDYGGTNRATFDQSGNLTVTGNLTASGVANLNSGITTSALQVNGNANVTGTVSAGALNTGGCTWSNNSGYMYTGSSVNSAGDIVATGALRCGGTGGPYWQVNNGNMYTPYGLYVAGILGGGVSIRGAGAVQADPGGTAFYAPNGNVTCIQCNANVFNNTSDAALKTDITASAIGLDAVLGLAPKAFRWKAAPEREELGLIAQEVEAILPQAVSMAEDDLHGPLLGINYATITTALVGAVKELTARIAALEAK